MWDYKTVISFETAVKLTPHCANSPTLCWLFLKACDVFNYVLLMSESVWYTLAAIISAVLLTKLWLRHKRMKKINAESLVEKKRDKLRFEQSMLDLLEINCTQNNCEQEQELPKSCDKKDEIAAFNANKKPTRVTSGADSSTPDANKLKSDKKWNSNGAPKRIMNHLPDPSGQKKLPKWRI